MIYLLAGNVSQAQFYAKKHELRPWQWQYLCDIRQLRGVVRGVKVVRCGLWYMRHDLSEWHYIFRKRDCDVTSEAELSIGELRWMNS